MQKYRADFSEKQADGSTHWFARWFGGPTLARVNDCRIDGVDQRRAVYVTGEPNTFFSQPAATRVRGKYVKGFLTCDDSGLIFHPYDDFLPLLRGDA